MNKEALPRIDDSKEIREKILPLCRLKFGEIWRDPVGGHKVGCLDAINKKQIKDLMDGEKAELAVQDPPYNVIVGNSNTKN